MKRLCSDHATKPIRLQGTLSIFGLVAVLMLALPARASSVSNAVAVINAFGIDLYAREASNTGNLAFSPPAMAVPLVIAQRGARGQTAGQMARVLRLPEGRDPEVGFSDLLGTLSSSNYMTRCEFAVSSGIWVQEGCVLNRLFQRMAKTEFRSEINPADFLNSSAVARQQINDWVSERTHGKITQAADETLITRDTDLLLATTVYFKGDWLHPFNSEDTKQTLFRLPNGDSVSVAMMVDARAFRYTENSRLQVVEIPYADAAVPAEEDSNLSSVFSMIIILPKNASDLPDIERSLGPEQLDRLRKACHMEQVCVIIPRFTCSPTRRLGSTLKTMGMSDAFFPGRADFRGITSTRQLFIQDVVHSAHVRVDEQGTEAAAATLLALTHSAQPFPTADFKADHPFIFLIRDNRSNMILFLGRVQNPA